MPIEIAGIALNRVHRIKTLEQSHFVYQQVPGMQGSVVQNLGRESVRLQLEGIFYGAKALESLETLRKAYKQQKPVDFLADVVGQAYFSQVVLERFEVQQSAEYPDQFTYVLAIAEYVVDASKTAASHSVDASVKVDATGLMTATLLPDALQIGSLPEITNPVEPLKASLDPVKDTLQNLDTALSEFKDLFRL